MLENKSVWVFEMLNTPSQKIFFDKCVFESREDDVLPVDNSEKIYFSDRRSLEV